MSDSDDYKGYWRLADWNLEVIRHLSGIRVQQIGSRCYELRSQDNALYTAFDDAGHLSIYGQGFDFRFENLLLAGPDSTEEVIGHRLDQVLAGRQPDYSFKGVLTREELAALVDSVGISVEPRPENAVTTMPIPSVVDELYKAALLSGADEKLKRDWEESLPVLRNSGVALIALCRLMHESPEKTSQAMREAWSVLAKVGVWAPTDILEAREEAAAEDLFANAPARRHSR